jgi:hypothetical protein
VVSPEDVAGRPLLGEARRQVREGADRRVEGEVSVAAAAAMIVVGAATIVVGADMIVAGAPAHVAVAVAETSEEEEKEEEEEEEEVEVEVEKTKAHYSLRKYPLLAKATAIRWRS